METHIRAECLAARTDIRSVAWRWWALSFGLWQTQATLQHIPEDCHYNKFKDSRLQRCDVM